MGHHTRTHDTNCCISVHSLHPNPVPIHRHPMTWDVHRFMCAHRKPTCGCGLSTALTGSCACNKCSAIKYKNSRIISHLLSVALNFWLKRLGIANSTEGKATGRLGWDGKLFPRQVLILGQLPKTVMCTCKNLWILELGQPLPLLPA